MYLLWASQVVLVVKNLPASAGDVRDVGSTPGSGRSPEEGMATHSNILAWRIPMDRGGCQGIFLLEIPWAVKPGGLQSKALQRVNHSWRSLEQTHTYIDYIYRERERDQKKCLELALVKPTVCGSEMGRKCLLLPSLVLGQPLLLFSRLSSVTLIPDARLQGPMGPTRW